MARFLSLLALLSRRETSLGSSNWRNKRLSRAARLATSIVQTTLIVDRERVAVNKTNLQDHWHKFTQKSWPTLAKIRSNICGQKTASIEPSPTKTIPADRNNIRDVHTFRFISRLSIHEKKKNRKNFYFQPKIAIEEKSVRKRRKKHSMIWKVLRRKKSATRRKAKPVLR